MIRVDLHTHSYASPDGGLTLADYRKALRLRLLNFVAITDHNTIEAARAIHKVLGDRIIVGEEIKTTEGEIVGLYLKKAIPAGMSAQEAVAEIKRQKGLVYIPHPFETIRSGISEHTLHAIAQDVDIIELHNGRAVLQNRSRGARAWVELTKIAAASSSDAHNFSGLGRTFTSLPHPPTRNTLVELLQAASHHNSRPRLSAVTAPKRNRIRKFVRHST